MRKVVATGKTVEAATQHAIQQLQCSLDQVEVKVLIQPSRGFLGWIGARDAQVEVTVKEDLSATDKPSFTASQSESTRFSQGHVDSDRKISLDSVRNEELTTSEKADANWESGLTSVQEAVQEAFEFLKQVVESMGLEEVKMESSKVADQYQFRLYGKHIGMLIGKHGHTLDSLQYLVNLVANKRSERFVRIVLDAEGYRMRRQEALENLADRLAEKALRERNEVVLEPMSAAERKVIHTRLQSRTDIKTQSRGEDPHRRIVIIPRSSSIK